jgi:hypothetical protein
MIALPVKLALPVLLLALSICACSAQNETTPQSSVYSNLNRLLKIADTELDQNSPRVLRLLPEKKAVFIENVSRGEADQVWRIWSFGGWADRVTTIRANRDKLIDIARTTGRKETKTEALEAGDLAKMHKVLDRLSEVLVEPLPLPVRQSTATSGDDDVIIVEFMDSGDYKWAIRSLNITTNQSYKSIVELLAMLESGKWRARN